MSGNYGATNEPEGEPIFHFAYNTDTWVRSLTFESNLQRTYGPYGVEHGRSFSFTTDGNKIIGLMGQSGRYINAIGFHLSAPVGWVKVCPSWFHVSSPLAPSTKPYRSGWAKVRSTLGKQSSSFFLVQ